VFNLLVCKLNF